MPAILALTFENGFPRVKSPKVATVRRGRRVRARSAAPGRGLAQCREKHVAAPQRASIVPNGSKRTGAIIADGERRADTGRI
jgi:hypothetical protein